MTSTGAALELVRLTKQYGSTTAVDAIDLKIRSGSYCCLLGPSGCGKTTTLRMIAGHETVSSGDVVIGPKAGGGAGGGGGRRAAAARPPARRARVMMFQSPAPPPPPPGGNNVAFGLKM